MVRSSLSSLVALSITSFPVLASAAEPAGAQPEQLVIVSFDGRVMITRFVDKDAATRYGNMVYVRCAPRA